MMRYFLFVLLAAFSFPAFADSPITSTGFSTVYEDEVIVQTARSAGGVLTDELMQYLANDNNPIDVKMAVINELGWDFNGKSNTTAFIAYLKSTKKYKDEKTLKKKASGDILLCLAYLKAMDNYFDVKEAVVWADLALKKNAKSYTFQIIAGIIKAQAAFDTDWCKVYQLTNNVRTNASNLKMDMRSEAINIIFEYMDLYGDSCK